MSFMYLNLSYPWTTEMVMVAIVSVKLKIIKYDQGYSNGVING